MNSLIKKLTLSAALLPLAFSSATYAHEVKPVAADAAVEVVAPKGPALWKVADEDTTIYLFGTVHVLPTDIDWYKGKIADALGSSDKLVTEIYMVPGTEAKIQAAFKDKGTLPAGETLRGLLTDEQKTEYEAAMASIGIPANALDQLKPWLASINIAAVPLLKAGYSPDSGVEKVLEAKAGGIARGELESIDFQVGAFDSLPMTSQVNFMMETANGIDLIVPGLDSLIKEWVEGNPEGLATLMNEGFSDPVVAETLLYSRNRNWAEWIDTRLDTPGTIFIAVGAGHLAGNHSVQEVLETRGIATTRVQ